MINPYYGLLPFLIYLILVETTKNVLDAFAISFIFSLLAGIILKMCVKTSKMSLGFFICKLSLLLTFLFWLFLRNSLYNPHFYMLLPEIFVIILVMILRIPSVVPGLKNMLKGNSPLQKVFFYEFMGTLTWVQFLFTFHVFIAAFYELMRRDTPLASPLGDTIVYLLIPLTGIVALIVFENFKLQEIIKRLKKEEWLPIVNEKGEVKGKIARSVSVKMKNRFLHPVVRVALMYKGNIYLQRRDAGQVVDPRALDHPFEKYILFDNQIDATAKNSIIHIIGQELPIRFLIKYIFKNDITNRLVFLFVSRVENESDIENNPALSGKFWSTNEIEKVLEETPGVFCELFQQEYDYLKNIVISTDSLIQNLK